MKSYIGTKIIKAEPMDENTFLNSFGKSADTTNRETRLGYHVRDPNGYDSWSPKDVFEAAYRLISEAEYTLLDENESSDKRKDYFRAEGEAPDESTY